MAKKQNDSFVTTVKGAAGFARRAAELREQGYSVLMPGDQSYIPEDTGKQWADYIHTQLRSGEKTDGNKQRSDIPTLYFSSGNEQMTGTENIGTKGKGWIEWGLGDTLPNVVALLTHMLPYTASASKFNTDLCSGIGPQPMYDCTQYVGGNITQKPIRYKDAGQFLHGLIVDKRRELLKIQKEMDAATATVPDGSPSGNKGGVPMPSPSTLKTYNELCKSCEDQIKELEAAYTEWELTYPEVQDFIDRNNLSQTWLALTLDQMLFGISFPELQLNQNALGKDGKPVSTSLWNPRVVGIGHRSCHTTRLERMDDNGRINYVYSSVRWLDKPYLDQGGDQSAPIKAIPALSQQSPLGSLEDAVINARHSNVPAGKRPDRFVLPSVYPTAGRPYYPTPAWHSIFGGDIYEYLSTIISDRFNRKKNSNIIGRIIYLHNDYMQQLFIQSKAQSDAKKQGEIRDKLYTQINQWLSNRDNTGKSLLAFTFMGTDGKEHKSFEIVEIESTSASQAAANEKETAEISSIVFMAWGLDSKLLGSSPLSLVNSNGGTDLRERYLLRLILMSPTQQLMLKPLEVASRFNQWDRRLFWQIPREVMTTLDNSKTGITSAEDQA